MISNYSRDRLIDTAYRYMARDEALPLDLIADLNCAGVLVEELEDSFNNRGAQTNVN